MKRVIITGVSRGIGKATAEKFLAENWFVIGTSTSGQSALQNPNLQMYQLDFLKPHTIHSFAEIMAAVNETVDVLINNAGILLDDDAFPLKRETLQKTLDVNLIGTIDLTEKLLSLINEGGSIVSLSSGLGSLIDTNSSDPPAYKISKSGINMFTRALAIELAGRNITVSSIDPGWVKTDMGGTGGHRDPREPAREIYDLATNKVESGQFWLHGKKRQW